MWSGRDFQNHWLSHRRAHIIPSFTFLSSADENSKIMIWRTLICIDVLTFFFPFLLPCRIKHYNIHKCVCIQERRITVTLNKQNIKLIKRQLTLFILWHRLIFFTAKEKLCFRMISYQVGSSGMHMKTVSLKVILCKVAWLKSYPEWNLPNCNKIVSTVQLKENGLPCSAQSTVVQTITCALSSLWYLFITYTNLTN